MLRALNTNDRTTFDKAWQWTQDILQTRTSDQLLSWKYGSSNGGYKVLDQEAATDADLDVAYALITASEQWKSPKYLEQAKEIIKDIYNGRVKEYNGKSMLLPFSSNVDKGFEILNPSYFSPAYYKRFAKVDPSHNWTKLVDDTYWMLENIGQSRVLYPDWIKYNIKDNRFESAADFMQNPNTDNFSFDAMRVLWRLGYDYVTTKDDRAFKLLQRSADFIGQEANKGKVYSSYTPSGIKAVDYESGSMNSMAAIPLFLTNSNYENRIWKDKILQSTDYKSGTFQKNEIYYDQNLAWFSYQLNFKHNAIK
jgi:endoglucanase